MSVKKKTAHKLDEAHESREHDLSVDGFRKYNKVISKIDKIT